MRYQYIGEQSLKCSSSCCFFAENHDLDILLQCNGKTSLSVRLTMAKRPCGCVAAAYPSCRHMPRSEKGTLWHTGVGNREVMWGITSKF